MKYRKKPVVIEAVQWDGNNQSEIANFMGKMIRTKTSPEEDNPSGKITIETLEGDMTASIGDFIIKGVQGEFYPCKQDIFELTYEKVEDNSVDGQFVKDVTNHGGFTSGETTTNKNPYTAGPVSFDHHLSKEDEV